MNLTKRFVARPRIAASIVILLFSVVATGAKTSRAPVSKTTSQTAAEQVFNLSDFNSVGNGVADDGPALQRALDAIAAAGGGTLLIPAGSYRIATPVVKDFSSINGAKVVIQGVPSTTMPAPVTAQGEQLAAGLNLTSEIIPATGQVISAITLSNLDEFLIEHVGFTGIEPVQTDAFITLYLTDIDKATVRHCEFYGVSSFGVITELGGGNIIRAVRSELSVEQTVFLGCTGNSGAYAPVIENLEWKRFSISNSIFLDYGLRAFFSKTGMGAPLSWIGIEHAAPATPDSPRREVIIRDTFLDEGGWVGISVLPYRWVHPSPTIDLMYISGLKMNVSNMITTGHLIFDVRNLLIENSHYGWSHNSYAAIDLNRVENAILDNLTCIAHADRLRTDDLTGRLTVINSVYNTLDSLADITTVMETSPEQDPVQYVRNEFVAALGRQPDPTAHFYWSDLLIGCGIDNDCLDQQRSELSDYLRKTPQPNFSLAGTVTDEHNNAVSGVEVRLTGSEEVVATTDSQGSFRFSGLPTSGSYDVSVSKRHYTFEASHQTFVHPGTDVTAVFRVRSTTPSIAGRITKADGTGVGGVTLQLAESPETTITTDSNGFYSFPELAKGKNYTVVPSLTDFAFNPVSISFQDLSETRAADFTGTLMNFALAGSVTDENGEPLSGANISLTGSQSSAATSDAQGNFRFSGLPTSGSYTVAIEKRHYSFVVGNQSVTHPTDHVNVVFSARLNRHSIAGRITQADGTGLSGVTVQLAEAPSVTATTDANGFYTFTELAAGENYTVLPSANAWLFVPVNTTFEDLSADAAANFVGKIPELLIVEGSEFALALDAMSFMTQPFSIFNSLGFNTDGFIRVMVFAKNLETVSSASQVSALAQDDAGQTYPLEIEYMGAVAGQSWLKQLNLKLPSNSLNGKCVELKLSVADVNSNGGRICIANAK